jgi:hypothetical protein
VNIARPRFEETASQGGSATAPAAVPVVSQSAGWPRLRALCGMLLLIFGVLGVVLPIIPGIPFVIAGVALLGQNHPLVRACGKWVSPRLSASYRCWPFSRGRNSLQG